MNGEREGPPQDPSAAMLAEVAVAMIRDRAQGLELAARLGITDAGALALRDRLLESAPSVLDGSMDAQARTLRERTEELARITRIAEGYRNGSQHFHWLRSEARCRIEALQRAFRRAGPAARLWVVRHLPVSLRQRLRAVRACIRHRRGGCLARPASHAEDAGRRP